LIGATRQLIGTKGSPFAYRGSVGPVPLAAPLAARLQSLGDALARAFEPAGWFGVDYVLRDGIPWPVEINPRYTASVELHELAMGRSLLPEHRHACTEHPGAPLGGFQPDFPVSRVIAKWILYAPRRLVAPEIVPEHNNINDLLAVRSIADVPWPGTCVQPGEPVMTLMTEGADPAECGARMVRLVRTWTARLEITDEDLITNGISPDPWCLGDDDALNV
jgi:uncharacterized protein